MTSCVFCKILRNELPASRVYESAAVLAILDIQPVNAGHVLVIPKTHTESLTDVDDEILSEVIRVAKRVGKAFAGTSLRSEGYNVFLADGEAAFQEVPHAHLHVFPRYHGDGFGLKFADRYFEQLPSRDELDKIAEALRQQL